MVVSEARLFSVWIVGSDLGQDDLPEERFAAKIRAGEKVAGADFDEADSALMSSAGA